jgi:dTDP-glucose 4,6-dehydratase/UDP-glucuronate decarboxylase
MNNIVYTGMCNVVNSLGNLTNEFKHRKILLTGFKGFLGSNFLSFFKVLRDEIFKNEFELTCIDNNIVDLEDRTKELVEGFRVIDGDFSELETINEYDYIIHCAGIASPTFYRKYPLETIDVNAIGYWKMLKCLKPERVKGVLYFSTSEVYGDPDSNHIPTFEDYRGNVSCTGPRACYDESKRLGETISISFYNQKKIPVKIVRPFNVYGPYMRLDDKRVIPDFVKFAFNDRKIKIFSDGTPTRAFCYVSDALEGFLRVLLKGKPASPYNIGNDELEISMFDLANKIANIIGNTKVELLVSEENNYLTDNPRRRCPSIEKAKKELDYNPKTKLDEGLKSVLQWYKETYKLG